MGWDGSGNFSRTNGTNSGAETWQDDAASSTKILADRHDTHDQDLADGIGACITQDNQSKPTANFLPASDSTYDIGSNATRWKNGYFDVVYDAANVPTAKTSGAAGDGVTDDSTAMAALSGAVLITSGTYSIQVNTTITANLVFAGGTIKPASGITVTIVGTVSSPDQVIFDGSAGGSFDLTGVISTLRLTQFSGTYANDKWDNAVAWFMGSGQSNSYSFEIPRPDSNYDSTAVQTKNGRQYWMCDSTLNITNDCSEGTLYLHGAFFGMTAIGAAPIVRIGDSNKLNNLVIIGDLIAHADSTGTVTDCVWIDSVARLSIPGTINTQYGNYGTTIGGPNLTNNTGSIFIGRLHTFGYKIQGHRIAGGGAYSLSNWKIGDIVASSPNSTRTLVTYGLEIGGACFGWQIDNYTCTTAGAGQPDPKGCLKIKGDSTATQDGGRNKGGFIANVIGISLDELLLSVTGDSSSADVESVVIGNLRSESAGGSPSGDSRDVSIDWASNFKVLNYRDPANLTLTIGANCGTVEIEGLNNQNATISNSGTLTKINGLGYQAGIAAAAKPSNSWPVGSVVVNTADTPDTIWLKTQHTGTPANDYIQIG